MTTDDLPDLLGELTVAERCAVRLVDDIHRCAATSHVLSGVERYERLVTRVQSAALSSPDIPRFLTSVAVKLDSPSITAVDGVWHLDAILTWAVLWVCGRRNPYTEGDPLDIPIPLARANGVWAASCLTPWGDTRTGWVWFRKRPDLAQAETWLRPNRLPMKGGPHRAQQHPLRVSTTCLLTARAVGSPTAVAELLTVVTSVGKNRGHGYGSVREWGVRVMDGDPTPEWAWRSDDGRCLRPIPIDVATGLNATGRASVGHFTPPYWRSGGVPILCP